MLHQLNKCKIKENDNYGTIYYKMKPTVTNKRRVMNNNIQSDKNEAINNFKSVKDLVKVITSTAELITQMKNK